MPKKIKRTGESFMGKDLSPLAEALAGSRRKRAQRAAQTVPVNEHGLRTEPYAKLDPAWPCSNCVHLAADHNFMYGIGASDRYRCSKCDCGKQFEIHAVQVPTGTFDTEEGRQAFIKAHKAAQN